MSIKTVIMLVPDQHYPGPAGCWPCIYHKGVRSGCGKPLRVGIDCVTKSSYWVREVEASVSRNKREGKYRQQWVPYGLDVNVFRSMLVRGHYA